MRETADESPDIAGRRKMAGFGAAAAVSDIGKVVVECGEDDSCGE